MINIRWSYYAVKALEKAPIDIDIGYLTLTLTLRVDFRKLMFLDDDPALSSFLFQSEFPCFEYMGEGALTGFKKRLMLGVKDADVSRRARRMVDNADSHWGTEFYDKFQLWSNGIMP